MPAPVCADLVHPQATTKTTWVQVWAMVLDLFSGLNLVYISCPYLIIADKVTSLWQF